jgi:hypothetical protein
MSFVSHDMHGRDPNDKTTEGKASGAFSFGFDLDPIEPEFSSATAADGLNVVFDIPNAASSTGQ